MQTITLTTETIEAARVALLNAASTHAYKTLEYVALGYPDSAGLMAEFAFHCTRAWQEIARASTK